MIYYILDESSIKSGISSMKSNISVFFEHMSKWKYWQAAQCSSWTNSIFRSISDMKELVKNSNIYNRSKNNIESAYEDGLDAASEESKLNIDKLDKGKLLEEFPNIDSILDEINVKEWLYKYSKDDTSNKYINKGFNTYFK